MKDVSNSKSLIYEINKSDFHFSCLAITKMNLESEILAEELEKYQLISNPKRKKEFQNVRHLRNLQLGKQAISYDSRGKPYINNSKVFISISHSKNYVAFAHDTSPIGIDIEELNPRILKVWERFVHIEELALFDTTSIFDMTVLWTIKEALFKLSTSAGIDFKNDLRIKSKDGSTFLCEIRTENGFSNVKMGTSAYKNLIISYNLNK